MRITGGHQMRHEERQFLAGDRVRLNRNVAESLMRSMRSNRHSVDWLARRGIIIRVSEPADRVTVKWDDRNTIDFWPTRALKKTP
jgi:hypothetical protein